MTSIVAPTFTVIRTSLEERRAVRTTFAASRTPKVVVLLQFRETFSSHGQLYNSYQARVTHAGIIILDAIVDYPIIADPHAPLDLRRYDGATAFVLENAVDAIGSSAVRVVAAHQAYTRSALQSALAALSETPSALSAVA